MKTKNYRKIAVTFLATLKKCWPQEAKLALIMEEKGRKHQQQIR
jgi:hypothetical protein